MPEQAGIAVRQCEHCGREFNAREAWERCCCIGCTLENAVIDARNMATGRPLIRAGIGHQYHFVQR